MNLIFQYWLSRPVLPGAEHGAKCMSEYAGRVGATHYFARHKTYTERYGVDPRWFDKLRPVFDPELDKFDLVLVSDVDVFPVRGLTQSIFEEPLLGFGMCEEVDQPELREKYGRVFTTANDRKWAAYLAKRWGSNIPIDKKGRPRVWNAGVILFSPVGRQLIRTAAPATMKEYRDAINAQGFPPCYATEQCYLNMLAFSGVIPFTHLSVEWNRMVHHVGTQRETYDRRTPETKFVHVMFRAADHNNAAWHDSIVNNHLPQLETGR